MAEDRTVHGVTGNGWEIVRYERAGKWYAEHPNDAPRWLTVTDAACNLAEEDAAWFEGKPGGQKLDAKVRKLLRRVR